MNETLDSCCEPASGFSPVGIHSPSGRSCITMGLFDKPSGFFGSLTGRAEWLSVIVITICLARTRLKFPQQ